MEQQVNKVYQLILNKYSKLKAIFFGDKDPSEQVCFNEITKTTFALYQLKKWKRTTLKALDVYNKTYV